MLGERLLVFGIMTVFYVCTSSANRGFQIDSNCMRSLCRDYIVYMSVWR